MVLNKRAPVAPTTDTAAWNSVTGVANVSLLSAERNFAWRVCASVESLQLINTLAKRTILPLPNRIERYPLVVYPPPRMPSATGEEELYRNYR